MRTLWFSTMHFSGHLFFLPPRGFATLLPPPWLGESITTTRPSLKWVGGGRGARTGPSSRGIMASYKTTRYLGLKRSRKDVKGFLLRLCPLAFPGGPLFPQKGSSREAELPLSNFLHSPCSPLPVLPSALRAFTSLEHNQAPLQENVSKRERDTGREGES